MEQKSQTTIIESNKDQLVLKGMWENGYGICPRLLWRASNLDFFDKAIFSYLLSYTGAGQTCFPTWKVIMTDLNISKDRLNKSLKQLKKFHWIITKKKHNNKKSWIHNEYILNFQNPIAITLDSMLNSTNPIVVLPDYIKLEKDKPLIDYGYGFSLKKLWKRTDLDIYEKGLLTCLLCYSGLEKSCYPVMRVLAAELQISESKAWGCIKTLTQTKYISTKKWHKTEGSELYNEYVINLFADNFEPEIKIIKEKEVKNEQTTEQTSASFSGVHVDIAETGINSNIYNNNSINNNKKCIINNNDNPKNGLSASNFNLKLEAEENNPPLFINKIDPPSEKLEINKSSAKTIDLFPGYSEKLNNVPEVNIKAMPPVGFRIPADPQPASAVTSSSARVRQPGKYMFSSDGKIIEKPKELITNKYVRYWNEKVKANNKLTEIKVNYTKGQRSGEKTYISICEILDDFLSGKHRKLKNKEIPESFRTKYNIPADWKSLKLTEESIFTAIDRLVEAHSKNQAIDLPNRFSDFLFQWGKITKSYFLVFTLGNIDHFRLNVKPLNEDFTNSYISAFRGRYGKLSAEDKSRWIYATNFVYKQYLKRKNSIGQYQPDSPLNKAHVYANEHIRYLTDFFDKGWDIVPMINSLNWWDKYCQHVYYEHKDYLWKLTWTDFEIMKQKQCYEKNKKEAEEKKAVEELYKKDTEAFLERKKKNEFMPWWKNAPQIVQDECSGVGSEYVDKYLSQIDNL